LDQYQPLTITCQHLQTSSSRLQAEGLTRKSIRVLGVNGKIGLGVAWTKTVSIGCNKQGPGAQLTNAAGNCAGFEQAGITAVWEVIE